MGRARRSGRGRRDVELVASDPACLFDMILDLPSPGAMIARLVKEEADLVGGSGAQDDYRPPLLFDPTRRRAAGPGAQGLA